MCATFHSYPTHYQTDQDISNMEFTVIDIHTRLWYCPSTSMQEGWMNSWIVMRHTDTHTCILCVHMYAHAYMLIFYCQVVYKLLARSRPSALTQQQLYPQCNQWYCIQILHYCCAITQHTVGNKLSMTHALDVVAFISISAHYQQHLSCPCHTLAL